MNIIIGPPGTGKTTRLLSLVEEELDKEISSEDIGYFAFTNRAADEAKSRANTKFNLDTFKARIDLAYNKTKAEAFRTVGGTI